MYQRECTPKWIRSVTSYSCYRIPIDIQLIWAAILCVGMLILSESSQYLALKGHIEDAYKSPA
jgi:hypothetical protein